MGCCIGLRCVLGTLFNASQPVIHVVTPPWSSLNNSISSLLISKVLSINCNSSWRSCFGVWKYALKRLLIWILSTFPSVLLSKFINFFCTSSSTSCWTSLCFLNSSVYYSLRSKPVFAFCRCPFNTISFPSRLSAFSIYSTSINFKFLIWFSCSQETESCSVVSSLLSDKVWLLLQWIYLETDLMVAFSIARRWF